MTRPLSRALTRWTRAFIPPVSPVTGIAAANRATQSRTDSVVASTGTAMPSGRGAPAGAREPRPPTTTSSPVSVRSNHRATADAARAAVGA